MRHPDLLDADQMQEMMDLHRGDTFRDSDGETLRVEGFQTCGDVYVTDPTSTHPQDDRAGTWSLSISELFESWAANDVYPVSLKQADE